ncbi:hypothetical protein, partial [uncultured Ruthenibacterium sp.]|uniref:hypothetical protein n=1 Tax=uncultured Ruthenibacterium sp. TaxID=1905347 RepID=UPI002597E11C
MVQQKSFCCDSAYMLQYFRHKRYYSPKEFACGMDIYLTLYRKKRRAAAIIKRSVENAGNDQPEGAD